MKKSLSVIKISGKIIDNESQLENFLYDFHNLNSYKILVHGGGVQIDNDMEKLGLPIKKFEGKRITDLDTMGVVLMNAFKLNYRIVQKLSSFSPNNWPSYIGLWDDRAVWRSTKRPVGDNGIDYGFVGDVSEKSLNLKDMSFNYGVPVFPPITLCHYNNTYYNSNADNVATAIALALSPQYSVSLSFISDVPGVLDADKNLIERITEADYAELKQSGVVSGGMIPKLDSAFKAITKGVSAVEIRNSLVRAGTTITR